MHYDTNQDRGCTITRKEFVIESNARKLKSKDASEIMENDTWINDVWKCFHTSSTLHHFPPVTDDMKRKANSLQAKLVHRLYHHLPVRLKDETKHNSWCWKWSERNFGFVAAIMIMLGHIKDDFECFDTFILIRIIKNGSGVGKFHPGPSLTDIQNTREEQRLTW